MTSTSSDDGSTSRTSTSDETPTRTSSDNTAQRTKAAQETSTFVDFATVPAEDLSTSFSSTTIVTVLDGQSTTIVSSTPISTTLSTDQDKQRTKNISIIAGVSVGVAFLIILLLMVLFIWKRAKKERVTFMQLIRRRNREGKGAGSVGLLDSEFEDQVPYSDNPRGGTPMSQLGIPGSRGTTAMGMHSRGGSSISMAPGQTPMPVTYNNLRTASPMPPPVPSTVAIPRTAHSRQGSSESSPPSLYRTRASDTGSIFHEEGLRDSRAGFTDPLLYGPNRSSAVDLSSIVDDIMGPALPKPETFFNLGSTTSLPTVAGGTAAVAGAAAVGALGKSKSQPERAPTSHRELADAALGPLLVDTSASEKKENRQSVLGGLVTSSPTNGPIALPPTTSEKPLVNTSPSTPPEKKKQTSPFSSDSDYSFIEAPSEFGEMKPKADRQNSVGAVSALSRYSDANSLYFDPFRSVYEPPKTPEKDPDESQSFESPRSNRSVYYDWKKGREKAKPGVGGYVDGDDEDPDSPIDPTRLPKGAAAPFMLTPATSLPSHSIPQAQSSDFSLPAIPIMQTPAYSSSKLGGTSHPINLPQSEFGVMSSLPGGKVAAVVQNEMGTPTSLLGLPAGGAGAAPPPRHAGDVSVSGSRTASPAMASSSTRSSSPSDPEGFVYLPPAALQSQPVRGSPLATEVKLDEVETSPTKKRGVGGWLDRKVQRRH
ncbi:hypothetical protein DL96DRAFT_278564 [Flagelloscypha sp. PMI_526]|nr:hypothetical protein DL96DRAFT_278564 [Flagelloscypha sp. PMI_526]